MRGTGNFLISNHLKHCGLCPVPDDRDFLDRIDPLHQLLPRIRDKEKGIKYLVGKFCRYAGWGEIITDHCLKHDLSFRSIIREWDLEHSYGWDLWVYEAGKSEYVFSEMLSDVRFVSPAEVGGPVKHGDREVPLFPAGDLIINLVDKECKTSYNVTLPNHIFFPGIVRLQVVEKPDGVYVKFHGEGIGNFGPHNTVMGFLLFEGIVSGFRDYLYNKDLKARDPQRYELEQQLRGMQNNVP